MAKAKFSNNEKYPKLFVQIFCPGCQSHHYLSVHSIPEEPNRPVWGFNGNMESPTFTPSLLVWYEQNSFICHSFITDGKIQFLSDCTHALAGKTMDLPEL